MSFEIEAGFVLRRQIRGYLDRAIFTGKKIQYIECKGIMSSVFSVKGEDSDFVSRVISLALEDLE